MNTTYLLRSSIIFASTFAAFSCCPVIAQEDLSRDRPLIYASATPIAVHCANQPGAPVVGSCNIEVFAETLKTIPLLFEIGLETRENGARTVLWTNQHRWSDFLEMVAENDMDRNLKVNIVQPSERLRRVEGRGTPVEGMVDRIPPALEVGGGVSVLAIVSDALGNPLEPGVYRFSGRVRSEGAEFLGAAVGFNVDFRMSVRSGVGATTEDITEQQVQRYSLWGSALQQRGMPESQKVLEEALVLTRAYLEKGGGDKEGIYNVTPRYQAAILLMGLGRKKESVAMLQRAYSEGAAAKQCRWRPYLFLPDDDGNFEGPMPQHVKDVIYRVLQRLYMEEYGRPLHGIPQPGDGER